MGKEILLNPQITVDGVDLSNHCSQVEIVDSADEVDVTGFGASNKEILLGLGDGTMSATFFQDFATGSVDATLAHLQGSNSTFVVEVVAHKGTAVSDQNPKYRMTAVLPEYRPLSGSVGEASTIEASFRNASQSGIQRINT